MDLGLRDIRVVVAGGSRGIGRSIALAFAAEGASISICARGAEALAATRAELARLGGNTHAAVCDLAQAAAIDRYIEEAAGALGGIDVLVNNATGVFDRGNAWDSCLGVDLMAAVRASATAQSHLEQSPRAAIVNISSISGFMPSQREAAYGAAKAALIHLTTSQALALAPKKIRVNCVAPGSIEFPGGYWEQVGRDDPATYRSVLGGIPMGRYGRPEEIAKAVLFLASDLASWVTGHTLVADGGQLLRP
ncbi:MAG TPA: SDR family NAD(P)-dependent oxidoreductase [Alphaproteobacteria bacterium]|nr:SDR family NAD(P)-dependent oxidoreductase [Alphaproteobacteria bacterium]